MAEPKKPKEIKPKAPEHPGKTAPTEPPETVNKEDQKLVSTVQPSQGYFLGRLINFKERKKMGFSENAKAYPPAVLVEIIAHHPQDDFMRREYPDGSWVFVSLEEIAPLLSTFLFLVPIGRIQGSFPNDVSGKVQKHGLGFAIQD